MAKKLQLTSMPFANRQIAAECYADTIRDAEINGCVENTMNVLGRRDLFYLLTRLLHRKDINRDWLFERCWEVQLSPNGHLDLWSREHYKSTIITFGKTIQDVLDSHSKDSFYWDDEITVGIFSHTRPTAKKFLAQIMLEFEENTLLKQIYSDVLYENPRKEARFWSLDNGICVKRKSNARERTIEAHGLVDGQPTGMHFRILLFDDVVTLESITETQMPKTTAAWAISLNLGAEGGVRRTIGTRYHFNDTYRTMMERGSVKPRIHAGTDDGTPQGKPVFWSQDVMDEKRRDMGPYVYSCQILQNPKAENAMGFKEPWLRYYDAVPYQRGEKKWPKFWLYYLLCDPAGEKKKENDYTVMLVIALSPDGNMYLVDGIRDRLNLAERTDKMFELRFKYPIKHPVGYEKYGKDSDIEHIKLEMENRSRHFGITATGGPMAKNDRIRRLVPTFSNGNFWLPNELFFIDYEGNSQNLTEQFKDEFRSFPVATHDDVMDCAARIHDPQYAAKFPVDVPASMAPRLMQIKDGYDPLTYR